MSVFRRRHFAGEVILWAVRWYCRHGISYRELEEMLAERGVEVDHTTLCRGVQRYAPEFDKRLAWYRRRISFFWRVDETYVRVKSRSKYLYRAIDQDGATLDFWLTNRRNTEAAKRFLKSALKRSRDWPPRTINTDKNTAYSGAIAALKKEGMIPTDLEHRQIKVLNHRLEGDHGKPKTPEPADARLPVDADVQEGGVPALDRGRRQERRGRVHPPCLRPRNLTRP